MHIPGYLDWLPPARRPALIDAMAWRDDDLFWPAFLFHVGMARSATTAFDVDLADLDVYLGRFEDSASWPVFSASIGTGTMHLVVRNFPDDMGYDWVLDEDALADVDRIRAEEPDRLAVGMAIPWPLLSRDPVDLLIAMPAVGDENVPEEVAPRVRQALQAVGAVAHLDELAADVLRHRACLLQ